MDAIQQTYETIAEAYALPLYHWACRKLGNPDQARDLAQEVLVQVFASVRRDMAAGVPIQKPEHYVWRIAHYVWCNWLRKNTIYRQHVSIESLSLPTGEDFTETCALEEEQRLLLASLRRQMAGLDRLQREIMVSFYIDGRSVRQIAEKLGVSQSAVKWHLHETRRKLKERVTCMETADYVYRPRRLHMGISGQGVPALDTKRIEDSLVRQNLCIACYQSPKTLSELHEILGIPKAYLEEDLRWLTEREFLSEDRGRYATLFYIETAQDEQAKYAVYLRHRTAVSDALVDGLLEAEVAIRSIGFHGCGQPMERLLWMLIYRMADHIRIPYGDVEERPVRPDGGRYFPLGFDRTDFSQISKALDTSGWAYNGTMCNNRFWWFGLYNFGKSEIEDLVNAWTPDWLRLQRLLLRCLQEGLDPASLSEEERYDLSRLVQKGFVELSGGSVRPRFCVFTAEQYRRLEAEVFNPLERRLSPAVMALNRELEGYWKGKLPPSDPPPYSLGGAAGPI